MNTRFNLGKISLPVQVGKNEYDVIVVEDVQVEVEDINLKDVTNFMKEMPAIVKDLKEALAEPASSFPQQMQGLSMSPGFKVVDGGKMPEGLMKLLFDAGNKGGPLN